MNSAMHRLVNGIPSLGSYARVMAEIETLLNEPHSTLADLGDVIEKDPDLTARLLKLGNSSFFGFPHRLETVSEAVSVIGIQQVQELILASSVVELFDGIGADLADMESFWKHSLACGIGARCLAIARQMPKAEKFFVAGLLHDLGRLVLFSRAPDQVVEIFRLYQSRRMLLRQAEISILGFDHALIGETLMRSWQYPANLATAVAYHHSPMSAEIYQLESSIVHLADFLVHAMQMGHSGERFVPPLNQKAWERVGLATCILESVVRSIDEQIEIVQQAFLRPPKKVVPQPRGEP
ncbi:MAG: HDOD domain-containing protein [Limisphaerales bacterium]